MTLVPIANMWKGASTTPSWAAPPGLVKTCINFRNDVALGGMSKRGAMVLDNDLFTDDPPVTPLPNNAFKWVSIRGIIIAVGPAVVFAWDANGDAMVVQQFGDGAAGTGYVFGDNSTLPTREVGDVPAATFGYLTGVAVADIDLTIKAGTVIITRRDTNTDTIVALTAQQCVDYIEQDETSGTTVNKLAEAETFSELPDAPTDGDLHYVKIGENLDPAGWYVQLASGYDGATPAGIPRGAERIFPPHGKWFRVTDNDASFSDQAEDRYDPAKMPHRIIIDEANNRVIWDVCPWKHRISGNVGSNTEMPWTGGSIQTTEFKFSRMFLFANGSVTSSRENDFFNLYINIIDQINDADRIIKDISDTGLGNILGSTTTINGILINHENGQVVFRAPPNEKLTNGNGQNLLITSFQGTAVNPASSNDMVIVIDQFKDAHLYRWINEDIGLVYLSELTIHNPEVMYDLTIIDALFINRTAFLVTSEGDVLVHEIRILNLDELVQAAWSILRTFEIPVFVTSWAGTHIFITRDTSAGYSRLTHAHRDVKPPDNMDYLPYMDRLEIIDPGDMTFDENLGETTMSHTGRNGDLDLSRAFIRSGSAKQTWTKPLRIDGSNDPVFASDLTADSVYLGFRYTCESDLIELIPLTMDGVRLKRLAVFLRKSIELEIQIFDQARTRDLPITEEPDSRKKWQSHRWDVTKYGDGQLVNGIAITDSLGLSVDILIRLFSESLAPVTITALEYDAEKTGSGVNQ